jgi:hypothetical protein
MQRPRKVGAVSIYNLFLMVDSGTPKSSVTDLLVFAAVMTWLTLCMASAVNSNNPRLPVAFAYGL